MTYSAPDLKMIDEWTEAWTYYLIKASNELAMEKGSCKLSYQTKSSQGLVPNDTY